MNPQTYFSFPFLGFLLISLMLSACSQNNPSVDKSGTPEAATTAPTTIAQPATAPSETATEKEEERQDKYTYTNFTVIKWRGLLKINSKAPSKGQQFTGLEGIKFNKNSDFLIVVMNDDANFIVKPANFVTNPTDAVLCQDKDCDPKIQPNTVAALNPSLDKPAFIVTVIAWQGGVKINANDPVKGQKITSIKNVTFQRSSDFLFVEDAKGANFFIHPTNYNENDQNGVPCDPNICQALVVDAQLAGSTERKMYQSYKADVDQTKKPGKTAIESTGRNLTEKEREKLIRDAKAKSQVHIKNQTNQEVRQPVKTTPAVTKNPAQQEIPKSKQQIRQ